MACSMKKVRNYTPPSTDDLADLKASLGKTGDAMADLAGLGGSHQWRKYTGGKQPRALSAQMAFFMAARLALGEDELDRVYHEMRKMGARFDLEE